MHVKHILYALGVFACCVTASANEEFMLAYDVEINQQGEKFVLQQHGRRLSSTNAIITPIGRGGRGRLSLSLASLGKTTGVLRLDLYDDKAGINAVKTPAYSLDVEFSKESAKRDVVDTVDNITAELSYSRVPR